MENGFPFLFFATIGKYEHYEQYEQYEQYEKIPTMVVQKNNNNIKSV